MAMRLLGSVVAIVVAGAAAALASRPSVRSAPLWTKYTLDTTFRSEGAAAADVNRDGKMDVFAGAYWYEAPKWTSHELEAPKTFDAAGGYSDSFMNYAWDVNRDGWVDQIVIGFPGDKAIWRENPKGKPGHWVEHLIVKSTCNESAQFVDLLGNGKPVMLCGIDEKRLAWLEPSADINAEWVRHDISTDGQPGAQRFSHGLGFGDINGDGRNDVLTADGFYLQPADVRSSPWSFVSAKLGGACAHIYVADINRDKLPDLVCSSAHGIGVWWFERKPGAGYEFTQHVIDDRISQTHSMVMADMDRDKQPDFVTGKRWWAHGPKGDVNPDHPAVVVWYKAVQTSSGEVLWQRHEVDRDSGVGTQFCVADMNRDGRLDVITGNKKGVHVMIQAGAAKTRPR